MNLPRSTSSPAFQSGLWLRDMPPEVVNALYDAAQVRTLVKGQRLSEIGDVPEHLIGIDHGFVAIHTDDDQLLDLIAHIFGPGDWFGIAAMLSDRPRFVGSSALSDVRIVQISRTAFERIANAHPIVWRAVSVLSAMNAEIATRVARDTLIRSPAERCTATLARLVGRQPLPCELPITQTQFAGICSLSRGAVSKVLSELEKSGAISRGYASITVRKPL